MSNVKHLWVNADGQNGWMWKSLASGLGKRLGLRPVLIVQSEQDKRLYEKQADIPYDGEIVVREDVYAYVVRGGDPGEMSEDVIRQALAIEADYGIQIIRDLLAADRHLGRGFMVGGKGYPKSKTSESATLATAIGACVRGFRFAENLFRDFSPGLMIGLGSPQGLFARPLAEICRRNGVPIRCLESTRFGANFYWAEDPFENSEAFVRFLAGRPGPSPEEVESVQQRVAPNIFSASEGANAFYRKSTSIRYLAAQAAKTVAQYYYGRMRGYRKALVGIPPYRRVAEAMRIKCHYDFLNRVGVRDLLPYVGRRRVFFPLSTEPELTTTTLDLHLPNQLAIVLEIALALPPDAILFVKEHIWQFGLRDLNFYRTILEMPNVVLVHHDISGLDLIKSCDLVCVMVGSSGHEAAALGKHVLRYGRQGPTFLMPHVHRADGYTDRALIRRLLDDNTPESVMRRKRDGARYFLAMEEFGFDLSRVDLYARRHPLDDSEIGHLFDGLSASLAPYRAGMEPARAKT